jgi:hypothetical protein
MSQSSDSISFDFATLEANLKSAKTTDDRYAAIVNGPFLTPHQTALLFLGIIVLLVVNEQDKTIDRVALSDTAHADATKVVSAKRFEDIRIPLNAPDNLIAEVIQSQQPAGTADWLHLFTPELTPEQAHINQANSGIGYSMICPVNGDNVRGALIFSYFTYPESIAQQQHDFMERYTKLVTKYLK